jgi:hypothetical protein
LRAWLVAGRFSRVPGWFPGVFCQVQDRFRFFLRVLLCGTKETNNGTDDADDVIFYRAITTDPNFICRDVPCCAPFDTSVWNYFNLFAIRFVAVNYLHFETE